MRLRLPLLMIVCTLGLLAPLPAAGDLPAGSSDDAGLQIRRSRRSGRVGFVTAAGGGAIPLPPLPAAAGMPKEAAAVHVFLAVHGNLFGIDNPQQQLELVRSRRGRLGQQHLTLRQVHHGVPVFSGRLVVHLDEAEQVLAANGDVYVIPDRLDTIPTLAPAAAAAIARTQVVAGNPRVGSCQLVIVDPGWYGDPPRGPHLAYHAVVADPAVQVRDALFIDAHDGAILDHWNLLPGDRERYIYDGAGGTSLPGRLARAEGDPPVEPVTDPVAADINRAYDYSGDVYGYYEHAFGRDSLDDAGIPLVLTVNSTAAGDMCPSAFWSSALNQATFCLGRVPDDVVGHELTHGLTEMTANLIYQNQSGQLNESFSFVFGETIDLVNGGAEVAGIRDGPPAWSGHPSGAGNDANNRRTTCSGAPAYIDGVRWLYNEDHTGWGAFQDLWDPTCFGCPDHVDSPEQTCSVDAWGGTHNGAAIPNHAYAILADGQTFNGITVDGIGLVKAAAVWYRSLTVYLTPAADFEEAYWAFSQAATDLVGSEPLDPRNGEPSGDLFTAADAEQVGLALRAVGLETPGRCGQTADVLDAAAPPACTGRQAIWQDDFAAGLGGWTVSNSDPATPYDWQLSDAPLPFARPGRAAFCADLESQCGSSDESGVHHLDSPVIVLPGDLHLPVLAFTHLVLTEAEWDGGNVKIRVNGGAWQLLPAAAFSHNAYNRILLSNAVDNSNPLGGEPAFSGAGGGWGTSLASLAGMVSGGDAVQLRFDLGKDSCAGVTGWYVAEVQLFDCAGSLDCDADGQPDDVQTAAAGQPLVIANHPPDHGNRFFSDADLGGEVSVRAQRFTLLVPRTPQTITIWGGYYPSGTPQGDDSFTVILHANTTDGLPGEVIATWSPLTADRVRTGVIAVGLDEWRFRLTLPEPVTLQPGTYWLEIYNDTAGDADTFYWITSGMSFPVVNTAVATAAPGQAWSAAGMYHQAIEITGGLAGDDCNRNGVPDSCDTAAGLDSDGDGVPDSCQRPTPRRPRRRYRP